MDNTYDYTNEIKINQYALDIEWVTHAPLVLKYAQALAFARRVFDENKEACDLLEAKKDIKIREQTDKKLTEAAIAKIILVDTEMQAARSELLASKYSVNLITAATIAIDAKGRALTDLVKLHLNQYYAEPAADIEARGLLEDQRSHGVRKRVVINSPSTVDAPMARKKK